MALYTTNSPPQSLNDLTVTYDIENIEDIFFLNFVFKFHHKNAKIIFLNSIFSDTQSAKFHEFLRSSFRSKGYPCKQALVAKKQCA